MSTAKLTTAPNRRAVAQASALPLPIVASLFASLWRFVRTELQNSNVYLLPLRLFIGLGWLRCGVEKIMDIHWLTGQALVHFLQNQVGQDAVYFPFYQHLIHTVFEPNALLFSWLVIIGELLVGAAVMSGTLTNLALLAGLFMNINFVLAGVVSPSAFYIVIQSVLFISNVGATFGIDRFLAADVPSIFLAAQPTQNRPGIAFEKWSFLVLSLLLWVTAAEITPFIRDYSPHSVDDPAMLLFILATMGGMLLMIMFARQLPHSAYATASTAVDFIDEEHWEMTESLEALALQS
ncbi:MAG: hypothetical protein R3C14_25155 [Caldilineaceae bacterium]